MKRFKILLSSSLISVLLSCASGGAAQSATVIRDCTGTYLRIESKDWLVCNAEILNKHKEGSTVTAKFVKTDLCPEFNDKAVCMMYHENEGLVRITELR